MLPLPGRVSDLITACREHRKIRAERATMPVEQLDGWLERLLDAEDVMDDALKALDGES